MSAHTPTPWRVYGPTARDATIQVGSVSLNGTGDYVAEVFAMKDAALIAAAPDLLAALKAMLDLKIYAQPEMVETVTFARATIAKAEGKT